MIYLATPYTHADPAVMEDRFDQACRVAGLLMREGQIIFCPIAHTHPIAVRCELPRDFGYWERYDRAMLSVCNKVVVVKLPGWEESRGIAAEIRIAGELGLPVEYLDVEDSCMATVGNMAVKQLPGELNDAAR